MKLTRPSFRGSRSQVVRASVSLEMEQPACIYCELADALTNYPLCAACKLAEDREMDRLCYEADIEDKLFSESENDGTDQWDDGLSSKYVPLDPIYDCFEFLYEF